MGSGNGFVERRRIRRYAAKDSAVVKFYKQRMFNLVHPRVAGTAHILDMNTEGLSFQYESARMWSTEFQHLSISAAVDRQDIDGVNFTVIYDHTIDAAYSPVTARRCGIQFRELSPVQRARILHFVKDHTVYAPAPLRPVSQKPRPEAAAGPLKDGALYYVELIRR